MALMDDIRRRVREKHLKEKELKRKQEEQKKELERQRQEERKKEQERGLKKNQKDLERSQQGKQKNEQALQQPSKPASSGKDEYVRVKGRYGWTWTKRSDIDADARLQGVIGERPFSRRALDSALRSSFKKEETRDTVEGPVSFVSKAGAASPISDVTYSQSPAKKSAAIMEPGDPIATARRSLMEKEALKEVAGKGEDPADVTRRALKQKEHKEATRNVEDPIALARRLLLEKERKEAARKKADTSSLAALPQSPRQPVNGIESVHEDPVQASRRLARDREEGRARQRKKVARTKEARNPVALMERRNEARRSLSSPVADGSDATPPKVVDAILWDDSESGEPHEEEDKKKKRATGKKFSESRKEPNEEGVGGDKKKKPTRKKNGDGRTIAKQWSSLGSASGLYSDDSDGESDEEFENTLIPTFENPQFGPFPFEPLKLPSGNNAEYVHEVPASINRYLKPYQQKGITFLYSCIMVLDTGAILGDDMGLGKTVQIIALLASLLQKTGTGKDAIELNRRRRLIAAKRRELNAARDRALLFNGVNVAPTDKVEVEGLVLPKHAPILVIAPPSVVANWMKEFETWGYFGVGSYHGERQQALDRVKDGTHEVLVCGASLFLGDFDDIASVKWKLIVVDELHVFKNRKRKGYLRLEELREACACQIVGMTGTPMQNNHEELWNLVDLVQPGHFGDWDSFKGHISLPILFGRTKTAEADTVQRSIARSHQLKHKLDEIFIKRTKEEVLGNELPEKEESIIFCELTEIQKCLYEYVLTLPDFELLKYAHAPCDCGVNRSIFIGYKQLRDNKEKIAYLRRHRDDVTKRKDCCYKTPLNPFRDEEGQPFIHPLAPIWMSQHEDDEECKQCPFCIMFPALNKLYKLASHACLIQAEHDPNKLDVGTTAWKAAIKDVEFAKAAIPPEILSQLPGGSYVMQDGIMNDHATLSGKMQKLEKLLEIFNAGKNRVLLFSHWTKTLDVIQQFVQARGYSFIRLDGNTSQQKRQPLVDRFQKDKTIFLFLISTKAGGLGLNLTAANKVICFDMDYNPSHDEQAQDRAYRIGQSEDVQVIRLVSQGTIEELKYVRQIYKVQLRQETLGHHEDGGEAARMFRGVQGDKSRKGELYGIENLLKFKDGSFMDDLWKVSENRLSKRHRDVKMVSNNDLKNSLAKVSEAEIDEIGNCYQEAFDKAVASEHENQEEISGILSGRKAIHHQDFLRSDRGEAALKPGDEGFEEEMGGASQMVLNIFDRGGVDDDDDDDDDDMESVSKQSPALEPAKSGDLAMILKGQNDFNHKHPLRADRGDAALKPGEDGFEDETGGCSQMVLYILGRGGVDDEHESGSKLSSPEETPSPPRQPCGAEASFLRLETTEESPPTAEKTKNLISRETNAVPILELVAHAIAPITKAIATSNLPEAAVESLPKMTKKRAASPNREKSKTTFSARDICMPLYNKRKRSMK